MKTYGFLFFLVLFFVQDGKTQTTPKLHLFEHFTSSSCPNCGNRNPEFFDEVLTPFGDQVIHIAYHNHLPLTIDPFYQANIPENRGRSDFYQIQAAPSLVLNGKVLTPTKPLIEGSKVEAILEETSPLQLNVSHYKTDSIFNVEVNAELLQNLPSADYKLYVAVVEKEILFCTYFEYVFDNVFRAFLENANGTDFNLKTAGTSEQFEKTIKLNKDWEYERLYAVAFVQNAETKEIINAGTSKIVDKGETSRFSNDAFKLTSRVYHSRCGTPTGSILLGVCVNAYPAEVPEEVTYKWSNGATTQNLIDVPIGNYTVEIKDGKYDTVIERSFEIKPSNEIEIETTTTPANSNNLLGSVNVIASRGNGGFTIEWNDGNTNFIRNDLSKGIYSYVVTDADGCQKENSITIDRQFSIDDVAISVENVSCNGEQNGSLNINLLNSTVGDVVLIFKEDVLVQNAAQLAVGQYNYKVIDSFNDVLLEDVFEITEPNILETEILLNNENQLVANVTGGTPPYTFLWNDGTETATIEMPITYDYNLKVTDANECSSTVSLTFTDLDLQENSINTIKVFPNPVKKDELVCIVSSTKIKNVQLYAVDGSLVNNNSFTQNENRIELANLNAGLYILEVVLYNNKIEFVKLLVE